ncbi:MAG: glutamate--cysteine ligase, partial [Sciscionella sp.]
MGLAVSEQIYTPSDRERYRTKVRRCLEALARMLEERSFSFPRQQMGLEIELNLIDSELAPAMATGVVLEK